MGNAKKTFSPSRKLIAQGPHYGREDLEEELTGLLRIGGKILGGLCFGFRRSGRELNPHLHHEAAPLEGNRGLALAAPHHQRKTLVGRSDPKVVFLTRKRNHKKTGDARVELALQLAGGLPV
jgi:hypothetical protein